MAFASNHFVVIDFGPLDNPIWSALTTCQQSMARGAGLARRYPPDVSPLSALHEPKRQAFADFRPLVAPGEAAGLFTPAPFDLPDDWQIVRTMQIDQMIFTTAAALPVAFPDKQIRLLQQEDVPAMLALTAATQPGPFLPGTIRMGRYYGIRSPEGGLVAMAGERLRLEGFTEISAVCTDPRFRGQGNAGRLIKFLAAQIGAEGKIPFLHVKTDNKAKSLYQRIGFQIRRQVQVTVITPQ